MKNRNVWLVALMTALFVGVAGNAPVYANGGTDTPVAEVIDGVEADLQDFEVEIVVDWLESKVNTPAEIADIKPSQQREPDTSFSLISLFKPPVQIAVVSPIVSAAETKNTSVTEMIAPISNFGANLNNLGNETTPSSFIVAII